MNRILFITLLALLPCVFTSLQAQGKLQGRVVSTDGEPIPYVSVGVVSVATPYGTTTDNRGRYTLSINQSDSVTVRFSCTGFESQERRILIATGATCQLDISLHPAAKQLDAVTVSDDRIRSSAFTQINIKRIENNVGPSQSVESIIKTLPDVNSNNELSSQYSVRGGSFDENLVYIDGVEIYRPQLVRSGQQEGLSIINPDLVDHITFSPGGFDATYGDRMSSVLDIIYSRPTEPIRRVSLSLLGGSASAQGTIGNRFSYAVGFRHHSNRYLFKSMDTEGNYSTAYTDLQAILRYRVNDSLDLSLLSVWTNNIYGLVPYTRTTTFGTFNQSLKLNVYFDGLEDDRYRTLLGAFTLNYHPNDDLQIQWINSALSNREQENYDIQSQYWLYAIGVGENAADTNQFDQGVGTFLEHARNRQDMTIFSSQLKMVRYALLGSWNFGLQAQLERTSGRLREWKWVDSADFAYPTDHHTPGLDDTAVFNPLLQLYCNAANRVQTLRGIAYVQRDINLFTRHDNLFRITAGLRGQYYNTRSDSAALNSQFLLSPRLSASFKPHSGPDLLYRLVAGIYQQPTLYRELRNPDGSLCSGVPAQRSYLASASIDWNLRLHPLHHRQPPHPLQPLRACGRLRHRSLAPHQRRLRPGVGVMGLRLGHEDAGRPAQRQPWLAQPSHRPTLQLQDIRSGLPTLAPLVAHEPQLYLRHPHSNHLSQPDRPLHRALHPALLPSRLGQHHPAYTLRPHPLLAHRSAVRRHLRHRRSIQPLRLPQRRLLHLGGRLYQLLLGRPQLPHLSPIQHQTECHLLKRPTHQVHHP